MKGKISLMRFFLIDITRGKERKHVNFDTFWTKIRHERSRMGFESWFCCCLAVEADEMMHL